MPPVGSVVDRDLRRDAEALYAAVRNLIRTYQFRDRLRTCYHDISVTQCYALEALVRRGPMGLNDLARELRIEKSSASRMIDALVAKSYVARAVDPSDGRAVVIEITRKGRGIHDRIVEELVEEKLALLAHFGKTARKGAIRVVEELGRVAGARFSDTNDAGC